MTVALAPALQAACRAVSAEPASDLREACRAVPPLEALALVAPIATAASAARAPATDPLQAPADAPVSRSTVLQATAHRHARVTRAAAVARATPRPTAAVLLAPVPNTSVRKARPLLVPLHRAPAEAVQAAATTEAVAAHRRAEATTAAAHHREAALAAEATTEAARHRVQAAVQAAATVAEAAAQARAVTARAAVAAAAVVAATAPAVDVQVAAEEDNFRAITIG